MKKQEWLGHIIEVNNDFFIVQLNDLTNPSSGTYEIAEFKFQDIKEEDKNFIELGRMIHWIIDLSTQESKISFP